MSKYIGDQKNEVFLGNVEADEGIPDYLTAAQLKTVRLGELALDIEGNDLPGWRPMFIDQTESDAYHRIMMKRTFPNQHVW